MTALDTTRGAELRGFDAVHRRALVAGVAGAVLAALGALLDASRALQSWHLAFVFWASVSGGCLALALLNHLTGGAWGTVPRRVHEAAASTWPLLLLVAVPTLAAHALVFPWAGDDAPELHGGAAVWLTPTFFVARTVGGLAVLWLVARGLVRRSHDLDSHPDDRAVARRLRTYSAPTLALVVALSGFAGIDWLMCFDPHFISSLYGLWFVVGQGVAALAFTVIAVSWLRARPPFDDVVTADLLHDWGKLLLAFLMMWAYLSFSQYLLVWSANIPEEAAWYLHRATDGGRLVAGLLAVLHFAVPFALLLSRATKRDPRRLLAVAAALFALRWLDLFWQVAPELSGGGFVPAWTDLVALVGVGGLWAAAVCRHLAGERVLAAHAAPPATSSEEVPAHG